MTTTNYISALQQKMKHPSKSLMSYPSWVGFDPPMIESIVMHPSNLPTFKRVFVQDIISVRRTAPYDGLLTFMLGSISIKLDTNVQRVVTTNEWYSVPDYVLVDEEHPLKERFCSYGPEDMPYLAYAGKITNVVPVMLWLRPGGMNVVYLTRKHR